MIVASLPMYDWPEIRPYTDEFWQGLARHAGVSGSLNRELYQELWRNPELAFSQSCGYPFTHEFKGILRYVATPHYLAEGCEGSNYCSIIFAREAKAFPEFYGATVAVNSLDSMSGMLAMKLLVAPHLKGGEFFRRCKISGSHRNSLAEVQTKSADICAVDSVCIGLAKKHCPEIMKGLVEVARSPMVPGLPYVTRVQDPAIWNEAVKKTFADPALKKSREALLLRGYSVLEEGAYDQINALEKALPEFSL
jgi:ABC-type phosphate/phosphonate transport system substrate-binding protein